MGLYSPKLYDLCALEQYVHERVEAAAEQDRRPCPSPELLDEDIEEFFRAWASGREPPARGQVLSRSSTWEELESGVAWTFAGLEPEEDLVARVRARVKTAAKRNSILRLIDDFRSELAAGFDLSGLSAELVDQLILSGETIAKKALADRRFAEWAASRLRPSFRAMKFPRGKADE